MASGYVSVCSISDATGATSRAMNRCTVSISAARTSGSVSLMGASLEGDDSGATEGERSAESTHREGDDSGATEGERSAESTHREGDDSGATEGERSAESTHREEPSRRVGPV